MPNQQCKKEKPCQVKRFSSWSESSEHCGKPQCEQREVIVKEICCEEKKCCNRRYGYKIKQETAWRPVCCHDNKKGKKCDCKKDCAKPCKEVKYDCWSESSEHCEKPKCHERCVIVKEIKCKEDKNCNKRYGHKEKVEKPYTPIPCDNGNKYVEKKCDKKAPCAKKAVAKCHKKTCHQCH